MKREQTLGSWCFSAWGKLGKTNFSCCDISREYAKGRHVYARRAQFRAETVLVIGHHERVIRVTLVKECQRSDRSAGFQ